MKLVVFLFLSISAFAQINPEKINILRDKWGVPHIFAKTDPEVAYGLAYAHAEDDFKTIQLTLLAGKGMLGRLKGKEGASVDYVVELLHCREIVKEKYKTDLSEDYKALIEGYVQGLNAYAKNHPKEVLVKKSFPVNTEDYMTTVTLSLSVISGVDGVLGDIFKGKIKTLESFKAAGSNAFAISGSKTTDGVPYLNINSHQPLEGPVAWYEAHLCSEEGLNIIGGLFPGSPVVLHGVNENLGWAHTVNYPDRIDVYQMEINPANKYQYKFDNNWETLNQKTVKLKVKLGPIVIPVKKKALWSKYGATVQTDKGTFAIRYGANQDIRGMEQWYRMDKARNYSEFYKAMEMVAIPMFNTIYADRNDTIFYVSNAKIPLRPTGYDWKNTLPGNTSATLTTGFHKLQDLPQYVNPESGYLFNTNNTPFNASGEKDNLKAEKFDETMGYETHDNNRSMRFQELIAQHQKLSYEDFKKIKYDSQLPEKLAFQTDLSEFYLLKSAEHPAIKTQIESIQNWNKKAEIESKGAASFLVMYYYLFKKLKNTESGFDTKLSKDDCIEALTYVKKYLVDNFGKEEINLGELQKLVRGKDEKAIWGMPDVLTAIHSKPYKNGTMKAEAGESYIELVRFPKVGLPEIESVINYGASNHESDPNYASQMDLYLNKETKKMTLDKAQVIKDAVRNYHPK
ncbi:acylase [Lacihabitans sp. LS3-19]|uniref:penicillin acylase family protein n=1 Tax=Lacihabitans sp. LS3-19 TaxID=2487335 RepID=UPI0020CDC1D5|nr:penicillin acylase family protein [Lacihabitans sp. LS3-19]MCP9768618.1 acylase [Lacihabitans sp. LS3-19]